MKNLHPSPSWDDTPRTNALIDEVQSRPIPFDIAFWRLLELTQTLEVEIKKLKESRKGEKKAVVGKQRGGLTGKSARDS